jgi:hypothetical protein
LQKKLIHWLLQRLIANKCFIDGGNKLERFSLACSKGLTSKGVALLSDMCHLHKTAFFIVKDGGANKLGCFFWQYFE